MRRFIAAALCTIVTGTLIAGAGRASAATAPITVRSATPVQAGWTTQIEVSATATSPITKIVASLRQAASTSSTPFTSLSDFQQVSGDDTDGVWRSSSSAQLEMGVNDIDVEIDDAAGDHVTATVAGSINNKVTARFTEFSVSAHSLDVDHGPLGYQGRVVYTGPDGTDQPLTGTPVHLLGATGTPPTTGPDGRFSGTAYVEASGRVVPQLAGGAYVYPAWGPEEDVTVATTRTRIIGQVSPAQPVAVGDPVTITGQVQRQAPDGTWKPLARGTVALGSGSDYVSPPLNGEFTFQTVASADGTWALRWSPNLGEAYDRAATTVSVQDPAQLKHRTSLSASSNTAKVLPGDPVRLYGNLTDSAATSAVVPNSTARVEFSTDQKTWQRTSYAFGTDTTSYVDVRAVKTGYWRLVFDGHDQYLGSVSSPLLINVVRGTSRFTGLSIGPKYVTKGKQITISAELDGWNYLPVPGGWAPSSGRSVTIYFRALHTTKKVKIKTVRTDAHGRFRTGVTAVRGGTWYVSFAGDGRFLPVTGTGVYIHVR